MKLKEYLKRKGDGALSVQTGSVSRPFAVMDGYTPLKTPESGVYRSIREAIPVVDAALDKIVRLVGEFHVSCRDPGLNKQLQDFITNVRVGPCSVGLKEFTSAYLDSLLTYGNAVGEVVLSPDGGSIAALYNAKLDGISLREGISPLQPVLCVRGQGLEYHPVRYPDLVIFTPLSPAAGDIMGRSILRSLPFVADILMKIYNSVGQNFDRVANLRYAITYKPGASGLDKAYAKEIAAGISREWSEGMRSMKAGVIKDFVAVGDVDIKVIGADNQMLDISVPCRQMMEQIVAKLGLPPFMLGLHWSTTERMSKQQSDILTSELESYRGLLSGVIRRICRIWLALEGSGEELTVEWNDIILQDELESANARLINAQADSLGREEQEA